MLPYNSEIVYTLDDLDNWDFEGTSLAVLGYPVRHSISPQMHNGALAQLAKAHEEFSKWRYFKFEIHPDRLLEALPKFFEGAFHGLNLTVPHKTIAFGSIGNIDPQAMPIGAINTLIRSDEGYKGYNTDGYGLEKGIKASLGRSIAGSHIVLLGAGGAGRAAAVQCLDSACASLTVVNRNQERLEILIRELNDFALEKAIPIQYCSPDKADSFIRENCLVINATSLGLKEDDPLPIPKNALVGNLDFFDMIYNPTRTRAMERVRQAGGRTANGLSMLVHQGARSLEIWTDRPAPDATMLEAARKALAPS